MSSPSASDEAPTGAILLDNPHGPVARLTVSRPDKLNIVGAEMLASMLAHLQALAREPELRAVVLTGAGGRAFVGGADIAEMAGLDTRSARTFITGLHRVCDAIRKLPVPVVARIQGYCLGAGLEIAAACDLRVAAEGSVFAMPEVMVGIPSVIEAALLPNLIGWGRTRRLLLLGERIGATQAETWGLVERVVPPSALDAAIDEWTAALLAAGPRAIRAQKKLIGEWEEMTLRDAISAGIDSFANSFAHDEPGRLLGGFLDAKTKR